MCWSSRNECRVKAWTGNSLEGLETLGKLKAVTGSSRSPDIGYRDGEGGRMMLSPTGEDLEGGSHEDCGSDSPCSLEDNVCICKGWEIMWKGGRVRQGDVN